MEPVELKLTVGSAKETVHLGSLGLTSMADWDEEAVQG
jgi:hypothetical protein